MQVRHSVIVRVLPSDDPLPPAASFHHIGKKWSLILVSLPFTAGWLLLVLARDSAMLLVARSSSVSIVIMNYKSLARFITGFCGGMFVLAAPAYSSEIAEAKYRGALGSLMQVMVCLGMLFVNINCDTNWRGGD